MSTQAPDVNFANIPLKREPSGTPRAEFYVGKPATAEDREAILSRLYDSIHALNKKERLSALSTGEQSYLSELLVEVDFWESQRERPAEVDVMTRLEALTKQVLEFAGSREAV